MIYGHGDDTYRYKNIRINFSSNTKPGGMSRSLTEHLQKQVAANFSYPEPMAKTLANCIEKRDDLPSESVLITNGAVEAFYLIAAWKKNLKSLIFTPSFSEYEDACVANNHKIEFCPNTEFPQSINSSYDVFWLCNPNNPEGNIFNTDTLKEIIQQNTNTLFVVDEAYVDFVEENISLIDLVSKFDNLIITRSLTKRFSIPGLRLGYLVAAPAIVTHLLTGIIPWRINTLAQEAGLFCFSKEYTDNFQLSDFITESKRFQNEINSIEGFSVEASETGFFLVEGKQKASELKNDLATRHGMLIRDASNFRGLSENHFRVATQLPNENNELIKVLKACK